MNNFEQIYLWLKTCPKLYDLWVMSSLLEDKKTVVQPKTSANMYAVDHEPYQGGGGRYFFNPTEPFYFDVDIICYRAFYVAENSYNLDAQNEVQEVCDWLIEQQNTGNVPALSADYECYQIECLTPQPFIRSEYRSDADPNAYLVDHAVTVRFYTNNPAKKRVVVR